MHGNLNAQLIETYLEKRSDLRRLLIAHFKDAAIADDILQEMYLKIRNAVLKSPIENNTAFLFRVANNMAFDFRRQSSRRQRRDHSWNDTRSHFLGGEPIHIAPDVDTGIDARAKVARMVQLIKDLPPQCARVFVAHKLEGLSHAEVATRLGISKSTVEKHMSKALKYLTLHLDDGP